jgi:hypothetical protein
MSFELNPNYEQISVRREKLEQKITDFRNKIVEKFSETDQAKIIEALDFMLKIHLPQSDRVDGEPFASHPLAVAGRVAELSNNPDLVISALIHDSVEDQPEHIFVERIKRKHPNHNSLNISIDNETKEKYRSIFTTWSFKEIEDLFGHKIKYYTENMTNHDFGSLAESLSLEGDDKQEFVNRLYAEHVENIINDPDLFTLKLADLSINIDLNSLSQDSDKYRKLKRKYKSVIEAVLVKLQNIPENHPLYIKKDEIIDDLNKVYLEQYSN